MKKTTLCYLEHDGRYLMMLRNKKKNDQSEGKWLGIGGKFLEGETPEECLRREVAEETGFALDSLHFHGVVHFLSDVWDDEDMYLYTSCDFSWPRQQGEHADAQSEHADIPSKPDSDPNKSREHLANDRLSSLTSEPPTPICNEGTLSWIPKSQVLSLNLWEGDHLFLERLIAGQDFGELTVRYEGNTLVAVG